MNSIKKNIGLLIIRVGIGLIFIKLGFHKITAGQQLWYGLGTKMALLGITFSPTFWGFVVATSEFFGGILLAVGFYTRIASFFMGFTMFVATLFHINKGYSFKAISHPLSLLIVFIGLCFVGSGKYSCDYLLRKSS